MHSWINQIIKEKIGCQAKKDYRLFRGLQLRYSYIFYTFSIIFSLLNTDTSVSATFFGADNVYMFESSRLYRPHFPIQTGSFDLTR